MIKFAPMYRIICNVTGCYYMFPILFIISVLGTVLFLLKGF